MGLGNWPQNKTCNFFPTGRWPGDKTIRGLSKCYILSFPRGPTRSSRAYEISKSDVISFSVISSNTVLVYGSYQTIVLVYGHTERLQIREGLISDFCLIS